MKLLNPTVHGIETPPRPMPPQLDRPRRHLPRRVLCVFPRYASSFGTFQHAYPLIPGVRAFMPPQGLLIIAAAMPDTWEVRFIDENIRPAGPRDIAWADAVFISGMHVQRRHIEAIIRRAHEQGKIAVVGGPSVSACPAYYPEADILHLGEIGDATDALVDYLSATTQRPPHQLVFETRDRLPLKQFPRPAFHLVDLRHYFLGNIQFSSGCPFLCEFCDIPALYGRSPRVKPPPQILAELDAMLAAGVRGAIYFVDDNFIANPAAARELLPHLARWQRDNGNPIHFSCEATLNLAQNPDIVEAMRQANFTTVFCGIETPEAGALEAMQKKQNMRQPILETVGMLNAHGIEVVSGIILGLDTDTPQTADHVIDFIEASRIPMLTINMLYALPRTRLYDRLAGEGRLDDDPKRASNVRFKMPYHQVLEMWRRCIAAAYEPQRLLARFESQCERTFPRRLNPPQKVTASQVAFGMRILSRVMWRVGFRADYRAAFWRVAAPLLRTGRIEEFIHIGVVSHHLITYARECLAEGSEPCFYGDPSRGTEPANARIGPAAPLGA